MKKIITINAFAILSAFMLVTLGSCEKEEKTVEPEIFEITLYNPYSYPVYVKLSSFKNANRYYLTDKERYGCILGAGETKTYTGEIDNEKSSHVVIFFEDVTDEDDQGKRGIFVFYNARPGTNYCRQLDNMEALSLKNKPEVFLSSGDNNGGGVNNGNEEDEKGRGILEADHLDGERVHGEIVDML